MGCDFGEEVRSHNLYQYLSQSMSTASLDIRATSFAWHGDKPGKLLSRRTNVNTSYTVEELQRNGDRGEDVPLHGAFASIS